MCLYLCLYAKKIIGKPFFFFFWWVYIEVDRNLFKAKLQSVSHWFSLFIYFIKFSMIFIMPLPYEGWDIYAATETEVDGGTRPIAI